MLEPPRSGWPGHMRRLLPGDADRAHPAAAAGEGVAQPRAVAVPGSGTRAAGRNGPICRASAASASSPNSIIRRSIIPARTAIRPASTSISPALICDEIKVTCTIQARPFAGLLDALNEGRGDAVIASIAPTPETRRRADFTDPYYRTPARFVARVDSPIGDALPERLEGKKIAVIAGTAHEAFLKAMFTEAEVRSYANAEAAREALRNKEVDLLFGDGIALAFWLNGTDFAAAAGFAADRFWRAAISAKASA